MGIHGSGCSIPPWPSHAARRTLENSGHSRNVLDLLAMLTVPTEAVLLLEADSTTIGMAVEIWVEALERAKPGCPLKTILLRRAQPILTNGFFLAANLLDPRYRGRCLTTEQRSCAMDWLAKYSLGRALNGYLAAEGAFSLP